MPFLPYENRWGSLLPEIIDIKNARFLYLSQIPSRLFPQARNTSLEIALNNLC